jgi:hypothetical protein
MLTAQAPPRNEAIYETHHTQNAEIEGESPKPNTYSNYILPIPDTDGNILELDLADYDPAELTLSLQRSRHDSFNSGYLFSTDSPSSSPPVSWAATHLLSAYSCDLTEDQLLDAVSHRAEALKKQYEQALKVEEQVSRDISVRKKILGMLNERRKEELRRERERMAQRMRRWSCIEDL